MAAQKARISISQNILDSLPSFLQESTSPVAFPLYGGNISSVWKISVSDKNYCLKINSASLFPGMFDAEHQGLELLRSNCALHVPQVITTGLIEDQAFLLMEFIEDGKPQCEFWEFFGTQLANMHRKSASFFGLDHHNYIGSLVQKNNPHSTWASFYAEERLLQQAEDARNSGLLSGEEMSAIEKICAKLGDWMPPEAPSLLHGDLWSGNYLCSAKSLPVLIDPAVYYGHREMDLAMTRLFGGFPEEFYRAYSSSFPLITGFEERLSLFQLYPLLVHLNLFGRSYASSVNAVIQRFI